MCSPFGCLGSCAGSCAGSCVSSVFGKLFSFGRIKNGQQVKYTYTFGFILGSIFAYIIYLFGDNFPSFLKENICKGECVNAVSIFKLGLGMALYHILLCVLLIGARSQEDGRSFIHDGIWPIKILVWVGSIVGCFFIPDERFKNYSIACIFFGAIFIIFQAIAMVDFVWDIAENWLEKFEESQASIWKVLLIGSTFLCIGSTIAITSILYRHYTGDEGCQRNTFFITFNLILSAIMIALSVSPKIQEINPKSGILQSSFMSVYTSYLVASAIGSDRSGTCHSSSSSPSDSTLSTVMMYVGIVFGIVSLSYTAVSMGSSDVLDPGAAAETKAEQGEGKNDGDKGEETEEQVIDVRYNYSLFHFIFFLAIFYLTAVITQWSQLASIKESDGKETFEVNHKSVAPAWVQIIFSWISAGLYIWTLIAPIIFPDRNFTGK